MDSLTTGRVADVLKRLYQEAEIADRPLLERYRNRDVTPDELSTVRRNYAASCNGGGASNLASS
jgi:hypothetical protein